MDKKVGIILVNYKDYATKYLMACRDCLRRQKYSPDLFRIYIVDNASKEESFNYLRDSYPEATILIRSDGNYAAANNLGFRTAIEDGCEYLVTVNMDTEMEEDWLKELVLAVESQESIGIAQSKILLHSDDKNNLKINSLGNVFHFLGFGFTSHYGEVDRMIDGYPEIKGYASGCSFLIKKEIFEKVGGYNEEYYMYHDDLELSLKVRLVGNKIVLAPKSVIYHKYEFSRSVRMLYYMERNRYLTLMIFYPTYLFFALSIPLLLMDIGMFVFSILKGWFKTELKIYIYFFNYRTWCIIMKERERIKRMSSVPFKKVAKDFSGKIEFQEINNSILKYLVNPLFNLYWLIVKRII